MSFLATCIIYPTNVVVRTRWATTCLHGSVAGDMALVLSAESGLDDRKTDSRVWSCGVTTCYSGGVTTNDCSRGIRKNTESIPLLLIITVHEPSVSMINPQ